MREVAQTHARLCLALRSFFHPAAGRELLWNLRYAPLLRPLLGEIAEPERRALATRALDGYDERVLPQWARLRAQVVHGDYNLDNLLLEDDGEVAGILDFGDCCHTALAADVAVAIASFVRGRPPEDAFRVARIALDGFSSRLPLEPLELELLGDLVSARLVAIVAISAWRSRRFPENAEYIEAWDDDSWRLLALLDDLGPERVARELGARAPSAPTPELSRRRNEALGALLTPLTYARPVHAVRAEGVWIHEPDGSRLLDAYNNVPVVGHCHPRVTEAIVRQTRLSCGERALSGASHWSSSPSGCSRHSRRRQASTRCCSSTPAARRTTSPGGSRRRDHGKRRGPRDRARVPRRHHRDDRALSGGVAATEPAVPRRADPTAGKRGRPRPRSRRSST